MPPSRFSYILPGFQVMSHLKHDAASLTISTWSDIGTVSVKVRHRLLEQTELDPQVSSH